MSPAAADAAAGGPLHVFLVAAEPSGDHLGAALMHALHERTDGTILRCRRSADARSRTRKPLSHRRSSHHRVRRSLQAPPLSVPKDSGNGGRRRRVEPRRCSHHRQPRLHASCGKARACGRAPSPDRRLRVSSGVGVAPLACAGDARLPGSRARAAAVRTGFPCAAWRTAMHVRRSSSGATDRRTASEPDRSCATRGRAADRARASGKPPRRDRPHG